MAKTDTGLVQAVVAPRRSLIVQISPGVNRRALPGEVVSFPAEEAARLRAQGFLVATAGNGVSAGKLATQDRVPQPTINGRAGNQAGPGEAEAGATHPADQDPADTPAA